MTPPTPPPASSSDAPDLPGAATSAPPHGSRGHWRRWRDHLLLNEDLNFLLTNRLPRVLLTRWMGRLSRIENPALTRLLMAVWGVFTDLDLSEALDTRFTSLQACFTRALKPGARTVDTRPDLFTSPCDAIVGACGPIEGTLVFQAKGFPYTLEDLFGDPALAAPYRDGHFVTLRLTSSMYHRFHAPQHLDVHHVTYFSGDTWNVNPIALARVERLFCKNERALIQTTLSASGHPVALVPVAAILVASLRLHWLAGLLDLSYRGPHDIPCQAHFAKGQEMGWFQHGSTILVFTPPGFALAAGVKPGQRVKMGQALMHLPPTP